MTSTPPPSDRRARLKERTRQSILDAAGELLAESGPTFSVDALAERADVARRTIFNHFTSLDDVIASVGAHAFEPVLQTLVAAEVPQGTDVRQALVTDALIAVRNTDLVTPMVTYSRGLGLVEGMDASICTPDHSAIPPHAARLFLRSLVEINAGFGAALSERHPHADRLDVDLVIGSLIAQLTVLHHHWLAESHGADNADSRQLWSRLLDRLTVRIPAAS